MALIDNVNDVAFASSIPTDLILGSYTGTLSATAPGLGFPQRTQTSTTVATGIEEKTFFQGIFSTDGGTTWLDFNSNIPNNTNPSFVGLQTQMMYGYIKSGSLIVAADNWNYYNGIGYSSAAYTFTYKVVLFARPSQGNITPQPVTQARNFSSFYNYQKIFRDSTFDFSLPVGTSTAILTHGLGYVPKIRTYVDNFYAGGLVSTDTAALYDFGYFLSQYTIFQLYISTTTITYFIDNTGGAGPMTGTLYTRIYYDT